MTNLFLNLPAATSLTNLLPKHHFKIAILTILRHKGESFINVVGLAIGMTCYLLILIWAVDEFSLFKLNLKISNKLLLY